MKFKTKLLEKYMNFQLRHNKEDLCFMGCVMFAHMWCSKCRFSDVHCETLSRIRKAIK